MTRFPLFSILFSLTTLTHGGVGADKAGSTGDSEGLFSEERLQELKTACSQSDGSAVFDLEDTAVGRRTEAEKSITKSKLEDGNGAEYRFVHPALCFGKQAEQLETDQVLAVREFSDVSSLEEVSDSLGKGISWILTGKQRQYGLEPDPDEEPLPQNLDEVIRWVDVLRPVSDSSTSTSERKDGVRSFKLVARVRLRRGFDCGLARLKWIPEGAVGSEEQGTLLLRTGDCLALEGRGDAGTSGRSELLQHRLGSTPEEVQENEFSVGEIRFFITSGPGLGDGAATSAISLTDASVIHRLFNSQVASCESVSLFQGANCGPLGQVLRPVQPVPESPITLVNRINDERFFQKLEEFGPKANTGKPLDFSPFSESDKRCRDKWISSFQEYLLPTLVAETGSESEGGVRQSQRGQSHQCDYYKRRLQNDFLINLDVGKVFSKRAFQLLEGVSGNPFHWFLRYMRWTARKWWYGGISAGEEADSEVFDDVVYFGKEVAVEGEGSESEGGDTLRTLFLDHFLDYFFIAKRSLTAMEKTLQGKAETPSSGNPEASPELVTSEDLLRLNSGSSSAASEEAGVNGTLLSTARENLQIHSQLKENEPTPRGEYLVGLRESLGRAVKVEKISLASDSRRSTGVRNVVVEGKISKKELRVVVADVLRERLQVEDIGSSTSTEQILKTVVRELRKAQGVDTVVDSVTVSYQSKLLRLLAEAVLPGMIRLGYTVRFADISHCRRSCDPGELAWKEAVSSALAPVGIQESSESLQFSIPVAGIPDAGRYDGLLVGFWQPEAEHPRFLEYFLEPSSREKPAAERSSPRSEAESSRANIYMLGIDSTSRISFEHFAPKLAKLRKKLTGVEGGESHTLLEFRRFYTPVFGGTMPNMFPVYYGGSKQDCFYTKANRSETPEQCGVDEGAGSVFRVAAGNGYLTAVSTSDDDFPFPQVDHFLPRFHEEALGKSGLDLEVAERLALGGIGGVSSSGNRFDRCFAGHENGPASSNAVQRILGWNEGMLLGKGGDAEDKPVFLSSMLDWSHSKGIQELLRYDNEGVLLDHLERVLAGQGGQARDTIVILYSDHGRSDPQFGISDSASGSCDQKRPYLGVFVPNGKESELAEKLGLSDLKQLGALERLHALTGSLVSHWDLHQTLVELLGGESRGDTSGLIQSHPSKIDHGRGWLADFSATGKLHLQLKELKKRQRGRWHQLTGEPIETGGAEDAPDESDPATAVATPPPASHLFDRSKMKPRSVFSMPEIGSGHSYQAFYRRSCEEAGIATGGGHCENEDEGETGAVSGGSGAVIDDRTIYCAPHSELHDVTKLEVLLTSASSPDDEGFSLSKPYRDATCHLYTQLLEALLYLRTQQLDSQTGGEFSRQCGGGLKLKSVERLHFLTRKANAWMRENAVPDASFAETKVGVRFTTENTLPSGEVIHRVYEFDTYLPQHGFSGGEAFGNPSIPVILSLDLWVTRGEIRERDLQELTRYSAFEKCSPPGVDPMVCSCDTSTPYGV